MRATPWRRYGAEATGTFLLVFIGPGAAATNQFVGTNTIGTVGIALAFFFAILLAIASLGRISGAHINPAVTIGLWSVKRFEGRDVLPYVAAQCAGAILAALAVRAVVGQAVAGAATTPSVAVPTAFLVEFLFSAILMWVVMSVATDDRVSPTLAVIAIAGTVSALALQGALTGASMNPARTLGPAIVSGVWTAHWVYWIAPVAGMIVAARGYELLRTPNEAAISLQNVTVGATAASVKFKAARVGTRSAL